MKLHLFDIPDDPVLVPAWLESQVMGLHLRQLVAELTVMGNANGGPRRTLDEVLGTQRQAVLASGLECLPRAQLRLLLGQPELLLDLQRLVLDDGGDHWIKVPATAEMQDESARRWQHLEAAIGDNTDNKATPRPRSASWIWASGGWLVALAAVVFAVLIQGGQIRDLNKKVAEQASVNESLRKELQTQTMLANVRVLPADLPDHDDVRSMSADPRDLPSEDPEDLPDSIQ
jgi:hypothetical protein